MAQPITVDNILNEDIFVLLGLGGISDAEKEGFLDDMNTTVQARLLLAVEEQLGPEEARHMDELDGSEKLKFMEDHGVDLLAMMLEETLQYRLELVTAFQAATSPQPLTAAAA